MSFGLECNDGFYGDTCQNNCSTNCKSPACNKTNGICPGCKDRFHGNMCDTPCLSNCKSCKQADGVCKECEDGLFGDQCNKQCNSGCKYTTCHISDGLCECKPRHSQIEGSQCLPCPKNCLNSCNQQFYCDSCMDGYYGDYCNKTCSSNCKDNKCDRDGSCTCKPAAFTGCCPENCQGSCDDLSVCISCIAGYYGKYCNETCSNNCMTKTCDHLDGKCSCKLGYIGEKCTKGKNTTIISYNSMRIIICGVNMNLFIINYH